MVEGGKRLLATALTLCGLVNGFKPKMVIVGVFVIIAGVVAYFSGIEHTGNRK